MLPVYRPMARRPWLLPLRDRWGSRSLTVLSLPMLGRVLTALTGAVIDSGLALLEAKYLAGTGYVPQTTGGPQSAFALGAPGTSPLASDVWMRAGPTGPYT
jgi:hypothetical protein